MPARLGSEDLSRCPSNQHSNAYCDDSTVILRYEVFSAGQTRGLLSFSRLGIGLGIVVLIVNLVLKSTQDQAFFLASPTPYILNVVYACICVTLLLRAAAEFFLRVYDCLQKHKTWDRSRKISSAVSFTIIAAQTLGVLCWLASNVFLLATKCSWFSPVVLATNFAQWTAFNLMFVLFLVQAHSCTPCGPPPTAGTEAPIVTSVADQRWTNHWPKAIYWVAFQGVITAQLAYTVSQNVVGINNRSTVPDTVGIVGCPEVHSVDCMFDGAARTLTYIVMVMLLVYVLLWTFYIGRASSKLRQRSYQMYREVNLRMRINRRAKSWSLLSFMITVLLMFFVDADSCASYVQTYAGLAPAHFLLTGIVIGSAYLHMPSNAQESKEVLNVYLQKFAWLEAEKQEEIMKRNEAASGLLAKEPLFCFETAIKLLYWSNLVYFFDTDCNMQTAMVMYNLKRYEMFWEKQHHTKCIIAWGGSTILLAFRGTATLSNVISDLKMWTSKLETTKEEGKRMLMRHPAVHSGFLKAWHANGLSQKVLGRVKELVESRDEPCAGIRLMVTGHSMGASMAVLAARDIKTALPQLTNIVVYTFGAPRTGNHSFAKSYNQMIPDTWNVINDQDLITRWGKFGVLFKRPGHRVIINTAGDLIVRPRFVEASYQRVAFGSNVRDHFIGSYHRSMSQICAAQFQSKGFPEGHEGVLKLVEHGAGQLVVGRDMEVLQALTRGARGAYGAGHRFKSSLEKVFSCCYPSKFTGAGVPTQPWQGETRSGSPCVDAEQGVLSSDSSDSSSDSAQQSGMGASTSSQHGHVTVVDRWEEKGTHKHLHRTHAAKLRPQDGLPERVPMPETHKDASRGLATASSAAHDSPSESAQHTGASSDSGSATSELGQGQEPQKSVREGSMRLPHALAEISSNWVQEGPGPLPDAATDVAGKDEPERVTVFELGTEPEDDRPGFLKRVGYSLKRAK